MKKPVFLTSPTLEHPGIHHGFFTRVGGICQDLQDNGKDDLAVSFCKGLDPSEVRINRSRIEDAFGVPYVTAHQVHGVKVITATELWEAKTASPADGLVTTERNLGLGILTADCVPILFADIEAGVIGACHGGWRGLKDGIVEATVAAMETLGAGRARIRAAIGPCLGRHSYEVSLDFPENFEGVLSHHLSYFRPSMVTEKLLFDLPRVAKVMIETAGLNRPGVLDQDTFMLRDRYFSHRRATLKGDPDLGRQISLIALQ